MHHAVAHGLVDRAIIDRVVAAVGVGVVVDAMDILADHVLRFPTQHARTGRVDEGGQTVAVDAVDAVTDRTEQELIVAFGFLEQIENVAPFDQPTAHGALGVGLVALVLLMAQLAQHQDQLLLALDLKDGGGDFQLDAFTAFAVATQLFAPAATFVHDRLREHNQVRELMAEQLAHRQFQQLLTRIAEQLAGGDVQIAQPIGKRIEQHDGFGAMLEHHVP
ncbi:hypothetical protein D3C86_1021940 [compost metagenome]